MGVVAIAILAAGRGSRFGDNEPKPLALFRGQPLLSYALTAAQNSQLTPIYLVVGYQAQAVAQAVSPTVKIIPNPNWEAGIASSLQAVIQTLESTAIQAVCMGLADQPFITSRAYQRLAQAYTEGATFAVATYGGKRRNPVLIARPLWQAVQQLKGDVGAKQLMATYPVVEVPCDDVGSPQDIDTQPQLQTLSQLELTPNTTNL